MGRGEMLRRLCDPNPPRPGPPAPTPSVPPAPMGRGMRLLLLMGAPSRVGTPVRVPAPAAPPVPAPAAQSVPAPAAHFVAPQADHGPCPTCGACQPRRVAALMGLQLPPRSDSIVKCGVAVGTLR